MKATAATTRSTQAGAAQPGTVDTGERTRRSDAQRNRDHLLTVAATLFATRGVDVPLEEIARDAGVGIGTLYRNFGTRNELVEAVYRRELGRLCDSAEELLATLPPADALGEWMRRFAGYVAAKRGMGGVLKETLGADAELFTESRRRLYAAIDSLTAAAVAAGVIRSDVDSEDLIRALSGICMVNDSADAAPRSARLVDLLVDGLRYGATER